MYVDSRGGVVRPCSPAGRPAEVPGAPLRPAVPAPSLSNFGAPFSLPAAGELIAWSRILDDEEALCIVNVNGETARGADVLVDAPLNVADGGGHPFDDGPAFLEVVVNTAETAAGAEYTGTHAVGQRVPVKLRNGSAFVELRDVAPSEVIVLVNRP